MQDTQT